MTRVAVIVPCFNDGATVGEAVESLAGEEPHELVVVDDGSTDGPTLDVLASFAREGIRVIHRDNGGLSAARMTGVAATEAPYVFPLDADDLVVPGALTALADVLDATPGAAVAWGDLQLFGAFELHVPAPDALDPWLITYLSEIPGTSMLRRTALAEVGGWSLARGYEDWDLWLALAEHGWEGVRVERDVLRVRQGAARLNARWLDQHSDFVEELRRRHTALYARRGENRRTSRAPLRAKLLFPAIERLPLSAYDRFRLTRFVRDPVQMLAARRSRRAAAARSGD
jgi:glycosyltransferase involved in cell wall biosynthesis